MQINFPDCSAKCRSPFVWGNQWKGSSGKHFHSNPKFDFFLFNWPCNPAPNLRETNVIKL
jgi:hypothetical protein